MRVRQRRRFVLLCALASTLGACVSAGGGGMIASWYVVPGPETDVHGPETDEEAEQSRSQSPEATPAVSRPADIAEPLDPGIYIMLVNAGSSAGTWTIKEIAVNRRGGRLLPHGGESDLVIGEMWLLDAKMMRLVSPSWPGKLGPCEIPLRLYVRGTPTKRGPLGGNKTKVARVEIEGKLPSTLPHDWRNHGCDPNWPAPPPTVR